MVKKCVYCSAVVDDACVVDMCQRCMNSVWGEKMAATIIANMERERDAGNLELGCVGKEKDCSCEEVAIEVEVEEAPVFEEKNNLTEEIVEEIVESSKDISSKVDDDFLEIVPEVPENRWESSMEVDRNNLEGQSFVDAGIQEVSAEELLMDDNSKF